MTQQTPLPELNENEQRMMDLSTRLHKEAEDGLAELEELLAWRQERIDWFANDLKNHHPDKIQRIEALKTLVGERRKEGNDAHIAAMGAYLERTNTRSSRPGIRGSGRKPRTA